MVGVSSPSDAVERRAGQTFIGLLRALVPAVVIVLLLVWWQSGDPTPAQSVDPRGDIAYAQRVSPVPLPAPGALPAGWRATSARVDAPAGEKRSPVTLTVGYLTPADKFAEVVIGDRPVVSVLQDAAPSAMRDGSTVVGSSSWDRYRSARGEPVLATTVGKAAVVVTGDASDEDLVTLAGSVRAGSTQATR